MLRSQHNFIYTGITTDVERRLKQHNGELKGGAKALRGKGPCTVESVWQTDSRSSASKFECYIKSLNRRQKEQLINTIDVDTPAGFKQNVPIKIQRLKIQRT